MTKLVQPETKVEPQPVTVERISTPFDEAIEMAEHMFSVITKECESLGVSAPWGNRPRDLMSLDRTIRSLSEAFTIWCESIGTERFTIPEGK